MMRGFLNAIKNPMAYWMRVGMYIALAGLMGTTWFRMGTNQTTVNDRLAGLFFGAVFLSFMAVAGIPAFLEDRLVFIREHANGLYGVESYILSNLIVSIPFIFIITLSFSSVGYFSIGLQETTDKFCTFAIILFVTLMIAEAQTVLISVAIPVFVAALSVSAFLNGLWVIVQGFFISKKNLPAFWYYSFHQIDFMRYSYELLVTNEFTGLTFSCEQAATDECACIIPQSNKNSTCQFTGEDVLKFYEYDNISYTNWLLINAAIFVAFKVITVVFLKFQLSNKKKGKQWDPERSVMKAIMAPKISGMPSDQPVNPNIHRL